MNAADIWQEVKDRLKLQTTASMYQEVFPFSRAVSFDGEILVIEFPNAKAKEWAEVRLAGVVGRTVNAVTGGTPVGVRYVVNEERGSTAAAVQSEEATAVQEEHASTACALHVEDRRRGGFYMIDNLVMDEYLPVIGVKAFTVYSLLVRMSRNGEAWPGYDHICRTLRIGRATLVACNKILQAAGLIEIKAGNSERSNRYYLLDVVPLTEEKRIELGGSSDQNQGSSEQNQGSSASELGVVPVQNYGSSDTELEQETTNKTQRTRRMKKTPPMVPPVGGEVPRLSDNELTDWLEKLGITRSVAMKLVLQYEQDRIRAWVEYIQEQDSLVNPAGFLVSRLNSGGWPA